MTLPLLRRPSAMSDEDHELLLAASQLLDAAYEQGRHEVASAMRMASGEIVLGIHVDGSARRSAVCAEGVAAGNVFTRAAHAGQAPEVVACIAVLRRPAGTEHVIEPCGVCAELLSDYWPRARVWVTIGEEIVTRTAAELLPAKRIRGW